MSKTKASDIGIILTQDMKEILEIYRKLDKEQQQQMLAVIQGFCLGIKSKED